MRALRVVVLDVRSEHRGEMTFVEDEEAVEALGANCANESFGIGVGSGRSPRGTEDVDPFGAKNFVKDGTETLVPIVHQVLDLVDPVLSRFAQIPGDLGSRR